MRVLDDLTRSSLGVRQTPVGDGVPRRGTHRTRPEGSMRDLGVERVVDVFGAVVAVDDLELVLHPRAFGHLGRDVPEVGVPDPAQPERVGQTHHPMADHDLVGLAAPQERRSGAFDDGRTVALEEPVDDRVVDGPPVHQPVDGESSTLLLLGDRASGRASDRAEPGSKQGSRQPTHRADRAVVAEDARTLRERRRRGRGRPGCRRRAGGSWHPRTGAPGPAGSSGRPCGVGGARAASPRSPEHVPGPGPTPPRPACPAARCRCRARPCRSAPSPPPTRRPRAGPLEAARRTA